ncbi:MAG: FAD-binding protein [Thermoplasmata archaeon]|nr:FAD-binding protein [Thermoplasmata archaeon]
MDFAVLVKAVPSLDDLEYDPVRRTVVRSGAELFLNPFDQRALQVALQLRRPGERVSVVSLGPSPAGGPLRDAVVLGADRVLLISDPRFAGSDTLATSRALLAGLRGVGHDVVLAGAWTTDSETGQVGPEVAALLGVPVFSGARAVERDPTGTGLTVTVDTPSGWATFRTAAPTLLTVGEKITKPGKVSPEDRARISETAVEVLTLDDLGLPADSVGLAGSPTVVRFITEDSPRRRPVLIEGGSPAERVARAVGALRPHLSGPRSESVREAALFRPLAEDREVIVLVTDAAGSIDPSALSVLAEVRRSLPGYWPSAVWVGGPPAPKERVRIAEAGACGAYHIPADPLPCDSRATALAFGTVLARRPGAAAAVFLSDPFGRATAAHLAATRSLGLTGDAVAVREEPGVGLVWSKPSFGGRTIAGISSRTRPSLATVRPGVWAERAAGASVESFDWTVLPPAPTHERFAPVDSGREVVEGTPTPDARDVVVAVGMGVGGADGVAALAPLLHRWDAALGATRRVVDAGWVPRQFQVGLTGRALAPRLAVLLGVGGSANHLVGWKRARAVLAVNRDPSAAVFREVDVGIVGSVEEIVPVLAEAVAPLLGR